MLIYESDEGYDRTALREAITTVGDLKIVKVLLKHDADPKCGQDHRIVSNVPICRSWLKFEGTPCEIALYDASRGGRLDIVKLLLQYKADPNAPGEEFHG